MRSIDLQGMYTNDLPWHIDRAEELGITQDFFLLGIYKIKDISKINKLKKETELLKNNRYFLHGFFGNQNIFGRRVSEYLPYKCSKMTKNE